MASILLTTLTLLVRDDQGVIRSIVVDDYFKDNLYYKDVKRMFENSTFIAITLNSDCSYVSEIEAQELKYVLSLRILFAYVLC